MHILVCVKELHILVCVRELHILVCVRECTSWFAWESALLGLCERAAHFGLRERAAYLGLRERAAHLGLRGRVHILVYVRELHILVYVWELHILVFMRELHILVCVRELDSLWKVGLNEKKKILSIDNPFYSRYSKLPKFHFSKEIIRPYYTGWVVQKISNLLDPINMHILRMHQVSQIIQTWISLEGGSIISFSVLPIIICKQRHRSR